MGRSRHNETSEGYWSIGFLGKEVGYEISTCQMQYDAADKKTDQEDPCFIYITLEGTDLENVESIKYLGVTITSDLRWNTHVKLRSHKQSFCATFRTPCSLCWQISVGL